MEFFGYYPKDMGNGGTDKMARKNKMNVWDYIAVVLLIIGGLAWGLFAFGVEIVKIIFGSISGIVYGLVGLSAVYSIYSFGRLIFKK